MISVCVKLSMTWHSKALHSERIIKFSKAGIVPSASSNFLGSLWASTIVAVRVREEDARPTKAEMGDIPHHLFGHVPGNVRYSTGEWLREVQPVILDCLARGVVPIVTGGTGLYFKALTQGIADIPPVSDTAMSQAQSLLDEDGINALRRRAEEIDPVASARVLGNDPQRLLRIVSVYNLAKRDTRRFAKRQFTWFRGQAVDWRSIANDAQKRDFEANIPNKIL